MGPELIARHGGVIPEYRAWEQPVVAIDAAGKLVLSTRICSVMDSHRFMLGPVLDDWMEGRQSIMNISFKIDDVVAALCDMHLDMEINDGRTLPVTAKGDVAAIRKEFMRAIEMLDTIEFRNSQKDRE